MKKIITSAFLTKNKPDEDRWQDTLPSETAKSVAKLKYIASKLDHVSLQKFPFDKYLTSRLFRLCCFIFLDHVRAYIDKISPGLIGSIITRTYFIDEVIVKHINKIEQIVIVGAGYDGRAYSYLNTNPKIRIPEHIHIYELDLPKTLEPKRKLVNRLEEVPHNLSFVKFDADKKNLLETLDDAGVSLKKNTLFLMEGLIYYIQKESLVNLLRMIGQLNAVVVFDYFVEDFINKKNIDKYYGGRGYMDNVQSKLFEDQITGLPENITDFLENLSFTNIINLGPAQTEKLYLKNTGLKDLGFVRYVAAETISYSKS